MERRKGRKGGRAGGGGERGVYSSSDIAFIKYSKRFPKLFDQ